MTIYSNQNTKKLSEGVIAEILKETRALEPVWFSG